MATAPQTPPAPTQPHAPWLLISQPRRWLRIVGITLALAFLTVGAIQWRQYQLFNDSINDPRDNLAYALLQFEAQFQNLRHGLLEVTDTMSDEQIADVTLRYELFVSRIDLVTPERTDRLFPTTEWHQTLMRRIDNFVRQADQVLGEAPQQPFTPAQARGLFAQLDPMRDPVHTLAMLGLQRNGEMIAQRNEAARTQNRMGIAVTVFMSLLTLVFAVVARRQFNQSERRRLTLEALTVNLRHATATAQAASLAKSDFLATMSHELRTPFNGMLGMLELMQDDPLTPRQLEYIATATASGQHLLGILNDILDAAKLESDRMQVHLAPLCIAQLTHDVEALIAPVARSQALEFHCEIAPDVPAWVRSDGMRIKQILLNLLSNAVKFSAEGGVSLVVRSVSSPDGPQDERGWVEFVITDTGIGMDEAALAQLFKRFSQADSSISRRFGGTGLGLEISRNLARLLAGDIHVQSQPGQGSTFTLQLPLQGVAAPAVTEPPASSSAPASRQSIAQGLDILVAEDHPVNRRLIQTHLQQLGCEPRLAENGLLAVQAVQERTPDLIFMDLHMPEMNGLDATRAIRRLATTASQVKIVALTADASGESREKALGAGMNDFLSKPVRRKDIEEVLRRHCATTPATAPVTATATPAPITPEAPAVISAEPAPVHNDSEIWDAWTEELLDHALITELREDITPQGYARMLDRLLADQSRSYLNVIETLHSGDFQELKERAHSLKGAAASFGLKGVAAVALQLERAGMELPSTEAPRLEQQLQAVWSHTRQACVELGLASSSISEARDTSDTA